MASSQLLYANLTTRQLSATLGGGNFTFPTLIAGQTDFPIALRYCQSNDGAVSEVFLPVAALRIALGVIDQQPTSGKFKIKIGDSEDSDANITEFLNFNATAKTVESALNALSEKPAAFNVLEADGSWFIWLSTGARINLTVIHNQLLPISFGRVNAEQNDGAWRHELRLVQTPLAFTDTAAPVEPPLPFITTIRNGGSDESGVTTWTEIQRLDMPATFRGAFALQYGLAKTVLLSQADTAASIEAAINTALTGQLSGGTQISVRVTNPDDGYFHIEFSPAGVGMTTLEVIPGDAPPGDWTLSLSLSDAALYDALRTSPKLVAVPLEISADVWVDSNDHSLGTKAIVLAQTSVTVQAPVRWPEMATVPRIDWQRPPSPKSYIPYTPDQVLTGQQQAFPATIGNGVDTEFPIDHNLDCNVPIVLVREHFAGGRLLSQNEYTVRFPSNNSLTISAFATTPTASQYDVLVVGVGPASVFQAHNHTIAQIDGLQDLLNGYGSAITTLQSILPSVPSAGVPQSGTGIVIPLQQVSEVIGCKGVALAPDAKTGLKDSALPLPKLLSPLEKFDRELWRVAVNDKMLALGRKLTIDWGIALQLLRGNCAAEYRIVVQLGTYVDAGSPSHLNITWNTGSPVFTQPVVVTDEMTVHSFGVVIGRGMSGESETFTVSEMLYGILSGNNEAAPANANFAIRSLLMDLKTESVDPAEGWISFGLVPSITPLISGGTGCQATISS